MPWTDRVLSFEKPKKISTTEDHNERYQSDTNIAGTYVPNMSVEDELKWKAKHIQGKDPRVEIRKTVVGPAHDVCHARMLLVVKKETITISTNGRLVFDDKTFGEFWRAVEEARELL